MFVVEVNIFNDKMLRFDLADDVSALKKITFEMQL